MFKNYFKTAIRNLLRYKGFSFINILGLAIGVVGCLLIALFVWDEKKYDKHVIGGENIYRLYEEHDKPSGKTKAPCVPPAYAPFLRQTYPEVENSARMLMSGDKYLLEVGEKKNYEEKGWFVDSNFFQVIPVKFLSGDGYAALNTPLSIVISEDIANRYFGKGDVLGKTISVDKDTFEVRGVFESLPEHSHLNFQYLMSMSSTGFPQERMAKWDWHQFYTYVKLKPGTNVQQLEEKFQAHIKKELFPALTQERSTFMPFFQSLKDIHLQSADFIFDNAIRGNATYVKALSLIALFVLVIACFNFINLATARSFRRAKEIGVRKAVGAERKQLILQFIGETIFLAMLSVIFAAIVTFFIVPWLNDFTGKSISFNPFTNPGLGALIIFSGMMIGVIAGIYPALVLSGFQPIKVLKSNTSTGKGSGIGWLRQGLIVIQFALSALLIVSAIVVFRQTSFLNNKDLGFNKEQIVYFQVRDKLASDPATLETFKSELKRSQNIKSVTSGYGLPGDQYAGDGVKIQTNEGLKDHGAKVFIGDHNYIKTLGLKVIAGRDFSREMSTDVREAFIINETAVKEFGFGTPEKAIGKPMYWNEWVPQDTSQPLKKGKVVGVVQDFHYTSLHEQLTPSVIQLYPQVVFKVAVKLNTADAKNTIAHINNIWKQFAPGYPLDYKFMDESYGAMYKNEEKLASLLWIFTIMAIFVGCLGLFGLAAFSAEQRTKEIGIRKVLGASVFNILGLLSKNFIILVVISCVVAFPVAWWAMNNWLQDFPYRVRISWWVFGIAIVAALLIALITVSFQSIKAATANPVKSLRTE
jgi:putative ABC transport system permease protein